MIRVDGELKETTWKDALRIVAEKLKKTGKNTGIISTGSILNQDAFVLSKFASDVVKTKNIDTTVSLYADADSMKYSDSVELDTVDLIILVGLNPSQWGRVLPALDASVRKRIARGAKLVVIHSQETKIASAASIDFRGDEAQTLAQISKSLIAKGIKAGKDIESAVSGVNTSEDTDKVADLLTESKGAVILSVPSLFKASKNISLLTGVKALAVPFEANARGIVALGLTPEGKTYQEMVSSPSEVDVLYMIGEVPVEKRPEVKFLVVQVPYMTELARQADVVLPAAAFLESKGTIHNYLGKLKELVKVVDPPGDAKQHKDILIELSRVMGTPLKESTASIKSAFEVSAKQKFSPFEKQKGLDIDPTELNESMNKFVINSSRLLWLKETEKAVTA
jgi:predicted molibdopterin-dependent oxidoreductase YjgC